jgi:hypothetical protein
MGYHSLEKGQEQPKNRNKGRVCRGERKREGGRGKKYARIGKSERSRGSESESLTLSGEKAGSGLKDREGV